MARNFKHSCPKGGRCLVDVIISEYAVMHGEFTRSDILNDLATLKLTPRQASYRLRALVEDGTLTLMGKGGSARYVITERPRGLTYAMNLNPEPFEAIHSGVKTVEMRLNDEKRRFIDKGDFILFTNTKTGEKMPVEVKNRLEYPSFKELYAVHDKISIGYKPHEVADPDDMLEYYSAEKIEKYGVLALVIEKTKEQFD